MRDFEITHDVTDTRNSIGCVSYWLNSQKESVIWLSVICVPVVVLTVDFLTSARNMHAEFLYIVPIALVCWMFRLRKAVLTTCALLILSAVTYPLFRDASNVTTILGDIVVRVGAFTLLAAIVICYRHVFDQAQSLATHDRMTGALNKATFNERVAKMLTRSRRGDQIMLLLLLDLDGFKAVNDHHGHSAGDFVLQAFSHQVSSELRKSDCFGRLGGDEFGVALTADSICSARDLAETLQQRFIAILAQCPYAVTCSTGALIIPLTTTANPQNLISDADQLMYVAKREGKNRMKVAIAEQSSRERIAAPPLVPILAEIKDEFADQASGPLTNGGAYPEPSNVEPGKEHY